MNTEQFLQDFSSTFDNVDASAISLDTVLEDIEEWSSLQVMVVLAMIDSKYKIKVSGSAISDAITVGDIYKLI